MSESDIDMDRAMQGIDDADSHVQEITWTNCADAMPPDTNEHFIIRLLSFPKVIQSIDGNQAQDLNRYSWEWTPYTPEKWKELNK